MLANFDKVYVLGDSLSDTGNVLTFTGGQFPTSPYALGRFSNGDVWIDYLTGQLNLTVDPFATNMAPNDGTNFAVGGATSGNDNVGVVPLGLEQQFDAFDLLLAMDNQGSQVVLNDDLFFLWIGSNDYYSFIQDDAATPNTIEANFPSSKEEINNTVVEVVDNNIAEAIQNIIDFGGENIVVFNLPDLQKAPLGRDLEGEDRQTLRKLTNKHNKRLLSLVEETEALNPNVNIVHIDTNQLFDEILEDPGAFGFTDVTTNYSGIDLYAETSQAPAEGNPNEYLFWDSVHISTSAQSLVADLVIDELTTEGFII